MVVLYSTRPISGGPPKMVSRSPAFLHRQHLLFNLGRVCLYTYFGFISGFLGYLLRLRIEVEGYAGLLGGLFIILMGLNFTGFSPQLPFLDTFLSKSAWVFQAIWRQYRKLADSPGVFLLGCAHGFLPCPLLYTLFAFSASTGDPFRGALLMLVFSLGTVPAMWGLGTLAGWLNEKKRDKVLRVMGVVITLWGIVLLSHGLKTLGLLPHEISHEIPEISFFH
jgi:sulfite exporter TauE/SafE